MENLLTATQQTKQIKPSAKPRVFLNYIHNFRGLAIIMIVAIHVVREFPLSGNAIVANALLSITNNGTILFVFISGFLFFYLNERDFTYKKYFINKLKYVILPYLFISVPGLIDKLYFDSENHWWMTETYKSAPTVVKILWLLATGRQSAALWFIPMIILFYIAAPVLIKFGRFKYFGVITTALVVLGLFTVKFGYFANPFTSFIYFLPVYLLGMCICRYRENILPLLKNFLVPFLLVYFFMTMLEALDYISFNEFLELRESSEFSVMFNPTKLKALIFCMVLLLFFFRIDDRKNALLKKLGDYSFGIFFIHFYFINAELIIMNYLGLGLTEQNLLIVVVNLIIITGLCMLTVAAIKYFSGKKSRMIIGS